MEAIDQDEVAFVYFSPWHFAMERERSILSRCSEANIELFVSSISLLDEHLRSMGHRIMVVRAKDPVSWLRQAVSETGAERIVFDEPLFSVWHSIDLSGIGVPVVRVDSDLMGPSIKKTAMGRLADHLNSGFREPGGLSPRSTPMAIGLPTETVESYRPNRSLASKAAKSAKEALSRAIMISPIYGETRDRADGQTGLSRWLQNGMIDPTHAFRMIHEASGDSAMPLLRQLCFRETHIRKARSLGLTMEDGPDKWADSILDMASLEHFRSHRGRRNPMATLENLGKAMTGDEFVDRIMRWSLRNGVMPNRARMYFASWCYRNSATPSESFELCSSVFDLLLLDGQCPTNYVQNAEALKLNYGRVTPFREDNALAKLWPDPEQRSLFAKP